MANISDTFGGKLYERTHKARVQKEYDMSKGPAPAGEDRSMSNDKEPATVPLSTQESGTSAYPMEDQSKRRKQLDDAIDKAGG